MSGEALGWARKQTASGGMVAKAVLLLLADYCGENHDCWPSVPTIARELQSHERTIQRALSSLEADRLIEREARATGSGKTTSNRIRLDVECQAGGQGRGGVAPPSPPAERHPRGGAAPPSPPAQRHPHMNHQFNQELEPSFADAQDARAEAVEAKAGETRFERFMAAYPVSGLEKANWPKTRTAFAEQLPAADMVSDGDGAEALVACAERYAASGMLAKGTFGAVNPVEFLSGERWRAFLPGTPAAQAVASAAPVTGWAGPAEVWAAVCADRRLGEAWAGSYLAPCTVEGSVVHPRTGVAAETLRAKVASLLAEHGLTIGEIRRGGV